MAGVVIPTSIPGFSYTSTNYTTQLKERYGWFIFLKSSGTITFTEDQIVDVYIHAGGGGGGDCGQGGGGGGGDGWLASYYSIAVEANKPYDIVIGGGGSGPSMASAGGRGGTTSAFGYSVDGGYGGQYSGAGGAGYSGSGGHGGNSTGGNGWPGSSNTTYAFGDSDLGLIYGGCGGGGAPKYGGRGDGGKPYGATDAVSAAANTGAGGAGGNYNDGGNVSGGAGGSGIVIIRNTTVDTYPITFNGVHTIKNFSYQNITPTHMVFNTKSLF